MDNGKVVKVYQVVPSANIGPPKPSLPFLTKPPEPAKKKKTRSKLAIFLGIACFGLAVAVSLLGYENRQLKERGLADSQKIALLELQYDAVEQARRNLSGWYTDALTYKALVEDSVRIVADSPQYHMFWCEKITNAKEVSIHSVERCEQLGYTPCLICHEQQEP